MGQVWYLIVSIPDLCTLTNFVISFLCPSKAHTELPGFQKVKFWLPIKFLKPTQEIRVHSLFALFIPFIFSQFYIQLHILQYT